MNNNAWEDVSFSLKKKLIKYVLTNILLGGGVLSSKCDIGFYVSIRKIK